MSQLLPPSIDRGKSSQTVPLLIRAGETERLRATGSTFYVVASPAPVGIRADNMAESEYAAGCGMDCEGSAFFEILHVRNPHAFDVLVKVYVGFAKYRDQRAAVIEGATEIVGQPGTSIAPFSSLALSGVGNGRQIHRKAVVVSNLDLASFLVVVDALGNKCAVVFPKTSVTLQLSGAVSIANETAVAITAYVSEIFYVSS